MLPYRLDGRSTRKCAMLGEGTVIFGIAVVTVFFRNVKWSPKIVLSRCSLSVISVAFGDQVIVSSFLKTGRAGPSAPFSKPGIAYRKSECHCSRRNSPSVAACSPASSWSLTTSLMAASSTAASAAASIFPAVKSARAACRLAGRR